MNNLDAQSSALSAANRAAEWLISLQLANGSLRDMNDLHAYYKAPFALLVMGYNLEAERMLDFVTERFLKPDGDLDGSGVDWWEQFRIYPHGWLTIAAVMRGRFDIASSLLRTLVAFHDERSGGFFTSTESKKQREGREEIMSTSLAGLACLWAGRLDIASRTGSWLRRIFQAQPDLARGLYHVWDTRLGLVTEFPASEAKSHLVDASQPAQWYFQYGVSAAFLASLAAATQANEWLELAHKYLYASKHCQADVHRSPQSGKIGWGAAWCYRLSRDSADLEICRSVIAGLRDLQNDDGSWSVSGARSENSGGSAGDFDVTAEFIGLLGTMGLALSSYRAKPISA